MKCSVGIIYNNEQDVPRFEAVVDNGELDKAVPSGVWNGDSQLWEDELRLGDMVEPLGFDAIFGYEHHFSPYVQHPDPLQWGAFWAGRTKRIGVGTMLVVATWHNPIRLAEQLIQLQYMLGDRDMFIGIGRGLGIREYSGMGVKMSEARDRFIETLEIVQTAIREEAFEYKGKYFEFPDTSQREGLMSVRPRPRNPEKLLKSLYGGWLSPTTYSRLADLGIQPILIPNVAMDTYTPQLRDFASIRAAKGLPPANSIVCNAFGVCVGSQKEKEDVIAYVSSHPMASAELNYEFRKGYRSGIPGYEFYGTLEKAQQELVGAGQGGFPLESFVKTPDEWIKEITTFNDWYGSVPMDHFVITFNRLSLPIEVSEKGMQLFAKEVLPFVHELPVRTAEVPAS